MADAAASVRLRDTLSRLWSELEAQASSSDVRTLLTAEIYLEVDHGPLRAGLDSAGERHLLVPVGPDTHAANDRSNAAVQLNVRDLVLASGPVRFADLTCRRADLAGVFTGLAADICERLARSRKQALKTVAQALDEWRALFGISRQAWTLETIIGLYGELLVLRQALAIEPSAGDLWTGPTGAAHDFHSSHHAIEIKTTSGAAGRMIRVHGSDQLERPSQGLLSLGWQRVVESQDGETVMDLITRCINQSQHPSVILTALELLRLPPADHELVSGVRLQAVESRWYEVDGEFPRITPDVFRTGAVPAGVSAIEYSVDLDTVSGWADNGAEAIRRMVADR